ncbi:MAG: hypothetical protein MZU79_01620 [Anaerotruncus sp.]|nr:hypothetical protein [Anaerotruncus sp.]
MFIKMMLSGANVLLMDDPTNHLGFGIDHRTEPRHARGSRANILFTSHDQELIDDGRQPRHRRSTARSRSTSRATTKTIWTPSRTPPNGRLVVFFHVLWRCVSKYTSILLSA